MQGSEPRRDADARTELSKRALALMWIGWSFWLVTRPRGPSEVELSSDARLTFSLLGFAIVFLLAWGLFRPARWPVTASRGLMMALVLGVVVGPAGRETWVYAVDVAFAAAGSVLAYWLIRIGPRPLSETRRTDEYLARRTEARRGRFKK